MKALTPVFASWVGALALAASMAAQAAGIDPADQAKVAVGKSQDEVRQSLGEPTRVQTYLLAPGSTWLYTLARQHPDNEQVLRVVFDPQGRVTQVGTVSAGMVGLD